MNHQRALSGIRVLDFGQYIAAPCAGMTLREMGADVIKIEPLSGETARHIGIYGASMQLAYARGKRSIALDLRSKRGRAVAERLIARSDVVIQNFKEGAMQRLGLDAETVRAAHPEIVYASVTGFNPVTGSRPRPGLDIAAQAEAGIMAVTGEAGRDPQRVGFPVVDATAAHVLTQAILAALFARSNGHGGATIDVSLFDVAIHLQAVNWAEYALTGRAPHRSGNGQPTLAPAADVLETADGEIVLSAYQANHWEALCGVLRRPDLLEDPRFATPLSRAEQREALHVELAGYFGRRTTRQCVNELSEAGITIGAINDFDDIVASGQAEGSAVFINSADLGHSLPVGVSTPSRMSLGIDRVNTPPPEPGEHTTEILTELGYGPTEIADLTKNDIVRRVERLVS